MPSDLPWLKFHPAAWLADQCLRMCSLAAQGLWIGMLALMFNARRRGFLETAAGKPMSDEMLARLFCSSVEEIQHRRRELEAAGVPSIEDRTGIWYSRRMVRDEARRMRNTDNGRRGGNPALRQLSLNQSSPGRITDADNRNGRKSDKAEEEEQSRGEIPPSPQRGSSREEIMDVEERKNRRTMSKTALQLRVEKLFGRRETTPWDTATCRAWERNRAVVAGTSEEDFALLEWWFGLPPNTFELYRRKDLGTLLNNWSAEIDRAREFAARRGHPIKRQATHPPAIPPEPADWTAKFAALKAGNGWQVITGGRQAMRRLGDGAVFGWVDLPSDVRAELVGAVQTEVIPR